MLWERVVSTRASKSAKVPRAGRMAVWPPSSEPIAQGLPTSLGSGVVELLRPLRKAWPMGWMGGM